MRALVVCAVLSACRLEDPVESLVLEPFKVMELAPGESYDGQRAALGNGSIAFATAMRDQSGALYLTNGYVTLPLKRFTRAPRGLATLGDAVMFLAAADEGTGIWISTGTAEGTQLLAPVALDDVVDGTSARVFDGAYYVRLAASDALYASDGTAAGTYQALTGVRRVEATASHLLAITTSSELWSTSSSAAPLTKFLQLPGSETGCDAYPVRDAFYVVCSAGHLWRTDGTAAGTYPIANHGSSHVRPSGAAGINVLYTVEAAAGWPAVWATNGDANNAAKLFEFDLEDVVELGGKTLLGGRGGLWALAPGGNLRSVNPSQRGHAAVVVGDLIVFSSSFPGGDALSRTNGTPDGYYSTPTTIHLTDPHGFTRQGNVVYFRSFNDDPTCQPSHCADLWAITMDELRAPHH